MIGEADYLLRVLTIGSNLMLLALITAAQIRFTIKVPLMGMIIGVIGYLLNSTPLMTSDGPLDPLIDLVSMSTPFWIWLFSRRLFERSPTNRIMIAAASVMALGWFLANFVPMTSPTGFLILHFGSLALIADLVRVGVFGRDDDLVEQRRIIRLWLPLLVAAQAGQILLFEVIEAASGIEGRYPLGSLINTLVTFLICLFSGLALFKADPELLFRTEEAPDQDDATEPLSLSPSETVLHEKLTEAMKQGVYREPGLTIAGLADQLDTPEHRLRALINQGLGYRNFSAFLNRHRIAEAREKLVDREYVDTQVLTIAMDLGYNSLPTFNRAFRGETGTTPSDFRRLAISGNESPALEDAGQN